MADQSVIKMLLIHSSNDSTVATASDTGTATNFAAASSASRRFACLPRLKELLTVVAIVGAIGIVQGDVINVPNGSFESPATTFVDTRVDLWQKSAKPDWFDESGGHYWDQLVGVFQNTAAGSADHIDNLDGSQAIFFFAVPQVALFQDYASTSGTNSAPSHALDAVYEAGKAYQLKVGATGSGGIADGTTLEMSLYYRDVLGNRVTVASKTITYTSAVFTNATHLLDYQLDTSPVRTIDPWVGQHIGIQFLSTPNPVSAGGYWDLDNVRLSSAAGLSLSAARFSNGQFTFTVESQAGAKVEILSTTDLASPAAGWISLGTVTNATGSTLFVDQSGEFNRRFYKARQLP